MGSARERWRSVCVMGGNTGRGAKACSPNLGREDRQPEEDQGGEGEPRPFDPQPTSNREPVEPGIGPVRLVLLVLLSPLGH